MDGEHQAEARDQQTDARDQGTAIVGGAFLVIGVALLLDRLDILPWTSRWSVWPLLLIVYGAVNLFTSPARGSKGVFPIALGVWLWTVQAGRISLENSWPLMIIVLGLAIMWQTWASPVESEPLVRRRRRGNPLVAFAVFALIITATAIDGNRVSNWAQRPDTPRDSLNVFAMMGHAQRTASPERPFEGGQASAIMGQTEIDLRNAIVPDGQDVAIAVHVAMGQIVLRVPDGWTVDNRVSLVMGEVQDRRGLPDPLPRRRGRSRTTDWTTTQGGQGGPGAPGAPVAPDAPGAPSAADASSAQNGQSSETGPPGAAGAPSGAGPRLVLTGSVIMGSVLVRS